MSMLLSSWLPKCFFRIWKLQSHLLKNSIFTKHCIKNFTSVSFLTMLFWLKIITHNIILRERSHFFLFSFQHKGRDKSFIIEAHKSIVKWPKVNDSWKWFAGFLATLKQTISTIDLNIGCLWLFYFNKIC